MANKEMFIFVIGSIYIWITASFAFFASLYHTSHPCRLTPANLHLDIRIDYRDEERPLEGWKLSSKGNNRKWRNPYAPIPSKKLSSEQVTDVSLAVTPKKILPAVDLRTSVSKMRNNIKGISTTIRQVEETMDTLYGAMEVFENLGKRAPEPEVAAEKPEKNVSKKKSQAKEAPEKAVAEPAEAESGGNSNPLANIDIGQLLGLLQSPLVQSLISQTVGGNTSKQRKKEG